MNGVLKIHNDPINLDTLEIEDVSSKLKYFDDPILGDIEVLSKYNSVYNNISF